MPRKPKAEKWTNWIALELYHDRLLRDKPGDESSDWAKAKQIIRSPIRMALFVSKRLFIFVKVKACDTLKWLLFYLPQLEWMKLLAVPLVIAFASSIITGQIQKEANQNAVLKAYFDKLEDLTFTRKLLAETPNEGAIVLARGRTVAALRELDLSRREQLIDFLQASDLSQIKEDSAEPVISFKNQNLAGLDLSQINLSFLDFQGADLRSANLKGVDLREAKLQGADLRDANLQGADLTNANLKGAILTNANFKGAILIIANLDKAHLVEAKLQGADLTNANLQEADLTNAKLQGADLIIANLKGAHLEGANFEEARLGGAKLKGAHLEGANFKGAFLWYPNDDFTKLIGADLTNTDLSAVRNLNQSQLEPAKICGTYMPADVSLSQCRDCKKLGVEPEGLSSWSCARTEY